MQYLETRARNGSAQPLQAATLLLAHGAGAPMDSDFMTLMADSVASLGVTVIRFEFPYMQQRRQTGSRRPPNREPELLQCWKDVITQHDKEQPLFIGGKSMGGRMASLIADEMAVAGLVCLGYPFHPQNKPDRLRTAHLAELQTPALIVQGTRDALGSREEVAGYTLSPQISVHWLEDGNHDFKPRVKSGYTQLQHIETAAAETVRFIQQQRSEN